MVQVSEGSSYRESTVLRAIRRSASSNIVLYFRFFWLKGSVTLIRAETER